MLRHRGLSNAQASALLPSRKIASHFGPAAHPESTTLRPASTVARFLLLLLRYHQRDRSWERSSPPRSTNPAATVTALRAPHGQGLHPCWLGPRLPPADIP